MQLIFHDVRHDDRQFGHLMPQGLGVRAGQGLAAAATGRGFARDGFADLLPGNERALVPGMARLPPAFLAGLIRRRGRAAFAVKAVRRGRQGGVAGIGVQLGCRVRELLFELADLFLLLGDQGLGIVEFHLETTIGALQFGDTLLGVGLLQLNDTAAQGAQVEKYVLRDLGQRFRIHHADRQHSAILSIQPTGDYGSARDRVRCVHCLLK